MDVTNVVAANIREIREQKKLTLDVAAELTGVSRSMLAQIEKGAVNPTISVLWKIANGYKISFTSLMEPPKDVVAVTPESNVEPLTADEGRYVVYPVFRFDAEKQFEIYRAIIQPGGKLLAQPHLKRTEEYITVYAGEVEVCVDGVVYPLKTGDSIRFRADVPHSYHNVEEKEAQFNMLLYYPK